MGFLEDCEAWIDLRPHAPDCLVYEDGVCDCGKAKLLRQIRKRLAQNQGLDDESVDAKRSLEILRVVVKTKSMQRRPYLREPLEEVMRMLHKGRVP